MQASGAEVVQEPTEQSYGVRDCAVRDPAGNLHLADVEQLLGLLDRLVNSGKSVIVIEHHQAVMAEYPGRG